MKDGGYTIGKFFNFRPLVVSLWFIVFLFIGYALASADTFNVSTTDDTVDANPGDGNCADSNGNCSLRAAVMEANAQAQTDPSKSFIIVLQPGQTYTLTLDSNTFDEMDAQEDDLDIRSQITIEGNGATVQRSTNYSCNLGNVPPSVGEDFRIFDISGNNEVTLKSLTIKNGCASVTRTLLGDLAMDGGGY